MPAAHGVCYPGGAIRTLTPFFLLLWHPLSDVWWLPTNRHRLHTNRHRLHTNRHRLHTNRHRLPTGRHHRVYWTLRVFFFHYSTPCCYLINDVEQRGHPQRLFGAPVLNVFCPRTKHIICTCTVAYVNGHTGGVSSPRVGDPAQQLQNWVVIKKQKGGPILNNLCPHPQICTLA